MTDLPTTAAATRARILMLSNLAQRQKGGVERQRNWAEVEVLEQHLKTFA
jgi:hypothetical protein